MSASTTERQARIQRWIDFLEERARQLMDYNIEDLDIGERERAAQKCLLMLGRYIELEAQLDSDNPLDRNPAMYGIARERGPVRSGGG